MICWYNYIKGELNCDSILYPPIENVPLRFSILKRNYWMIDNADFVIAYVKYSIGGAFKTLEYAKTQKVLYCNIANDN